MPEDLAVGRQMLADLTLIIAGAQRSIQERGGYAANPTASAFLACLSSVAGCAAAGGENLSEALESLTAVSLRSLARLEK